jgi:Flp pilus assembly protein TadD
MALDHMSGGSIDRAVTLLRQAQQLDPGNVMIRRDLARATRIQGAVRRPAVGG